MIDLETLIEAINAATRTINVCVPSGDFYSPRDTWVEDSITFVDPELLIEKLKELSEDSK